MLQTDCERLLKIDRGRDSITISTQDEVIITTDSVQVVCVCFASVTQNFHPQFVKLASTDFGFQLSQ